MTECGSKQVPGICAIDKGKLTAKKKGGIAAKAVNRFCNIPQELELLSLSIL
jgi:hypothetical protein